MTEKAKSLIIDAFEDIVARTSEVPLESTDANTAIRALNRIMASLAANGISLGYTAISDMGDTITVPDGAIDPMIALLAMRLWPKYRKEEISTSVVINARQAMTTLSKLALEDVTASMPSTLPVGSGNYAVDGDRFYSEDLDSVLTEITGTIALEDDTL